MLYTVIQRGFKGDTEVYEKDIVSVFSKVFNYNKEWDAFMNIAEQESLEVVISNTTEAGLAYKEVKLEEVSTEGLYPAKLTAFLMHRFNVLGNISKKLLIFPCELVAENGKVLKGFVEKHSNDFGASEEFKFRDAYEVSGFNYDSFIALLEAGKIYVDLRIGQYHSGRNAGKTHDHGTGFRIREYDQPFLFTNNLRID